MTWARLIQRGLLPAQRAARGRTHLHPDGSITRSSVCFAVSAPISTGSAPGPEQVVYPQPRRLTASRARPFQFVYSQPIRHTAFRAAVTRWARVQGAYFRNNGPARSTGPPTGQIIRTHAKGNHHAPTHRHAPACPTPQDRVGDARARGFEALTQA